MKKIYYTDISNIKLDDINLSLISNERITKCNLIKDDKKKIQSLTAYLLLKYAFKELNVFVNDYEFEYENNKPYLKGINYHFNITHSKNIVAVVVSNSVIGVDCEYIDLERELKAINYLFTQNELIEFMKLDEMSRKHYFYKKWVEKEAYFKMLGKGLTKDFSNKESLGYKIYFLTDKVGLSYYMCSTNQELIPEEIEFNTINELYHT